MEADCIGEGRGHCRNEYMRGEQVEVKEGDSTNPGQATWSHGWIVGPTAPSGTLEMAWEELRETPWVAARARSRQGHDHSPPVLQRHHVVTMGVAAARHRAAGVTPLRPVPPEAPPRGTRAGALVTWGPERWREAGLPLRAAAVGTGRAGGVGHRGRTRSWPVPGARPGRQWPSSSRASAPRPAGPLDRGCPGGRFPERCAPRAPEPSASREPRVPCEPPEPSAPRAPREPRAPWSSLCPVSPLCPTRPVRPVSPLCPGALCAPCAPASRSSIRSDHLSAGGKRPELGGGSTGAGAGADGRSRSRQQLKQQRDKLRQYQKRVTQQLERERALARQLLRDGRKERAKLLLKKKRYREQLLDRAENQISSLEAMVQSIEFTQIEMKVMEGLQVGNECLNKMHQVMSIEEVERILDETQEAVEYQRQIDELLAGSFTQEDEDAILEELDAITQEQIELPDVPSEPLPEIKPEKVSVRAKSKQPELVAAS
ncbi:PREDICTED: charged multivesicular body protein 6 [Dipodomys ordii]|uniref:Charged multivesicular body protein 6 n=3 Tax=Rodentia TaxID=9989 RepID=A0A1S3GUP7_DIPOR|nr:PREDICTED: charged multivesicular body protein 6 [Dipodomys ordii]